MATATRRVHYTYSEYTALEDESPIRHEYLAGEIYAMAGGSPDHAALAAAVIRALAAELRPSRRPFTSDLRIRISATGLSTYPDVSVVCGKTERAAEDPLAVTNPALLVEITSPSTEDYDRGEKLRHYQQLPSVSEILIVSHRGPHITLHRRDSSGWLVIEGGAGDTLELSSIGVKLNVDAVYRDGLEDANVVA
jgi:Uma2 family endonuclease